MVCFVLGGKAISTELNLESILIIRPRNFTDSSIAIQKSSEQIDSTKAAATVISEGWTKSVGPFDPDRWGFSPTSFASIKQSVVCSRWDALSFVLMAESSAYGDLSESAATCWSIFERTVSKAALNAGPPVGRPAPVPFYVIIDCYFVRSDYYLMIFFVVFWLE